MRNRLLVLVVRVEERLRVEVDREVALRGAREPPGLCTLALHLREPSAVRAHVVRASIARDGKFAHLLLRLC